VSTETGLVADAVTEARHALEARVGADWSAGAVDLDWTCWETGVHIASSLVWYASQVIGRNVEGYLSFNVAMDAGASASDLLDLIEFGGVILNRSVASADPRDRAFHFYGVSDPEGFAAMGTLETLVHTYDITRSLDVDWRPPARLCAPVLRRLFPEAPDGAAPDVFLWCTGRAALGNRPRQDDWQWDATVATGAQEDSI
jgi:hypothetical protein